MIDMQKWSWLSGGSKKSHIQEIKEGIGNEKCQGNKKRKKENKIIRKGHLQSFISVLRKIKKRIPAA